MTHSSIRTCDGLPDCYICRAEDEARKAKARAKSALANAARKVRDQIRRDHGLVKARGALGGTYWE